MRRGLRYSEMNNLLALANGIVATAGYLLVIAGLMQEVPRKRFFVVGVLLVVVCMLMGSRRHGFAFVLVPAGLLFLRFEDVHSKLWVRVVLVLAKSVGAVGIVLFSYVPLSSMVAAFYPAFVTHIYRDLFLAPAVLLNSAVGCAILRKKRVKILPNIYTFLCSVFVLILVALYGAATGRMNIQNIRAASVANLFIFTNSVVAFTIFCHSMYEWYQKRSENAVRAENVELAKRLTETQHIQSRLLLGVTMFADASDMPGLRRFLHKTMLPMANRPLGAEQIGNIQDIPLRAIIYGTAKEIETTRLYPLRVDVPSAFCIPAELSRPVCYLANIYIDNAMGYLDLNPGGSLSISAIEVKGYACLEIANTLEDDFNKGSMDTLEPVGKQLHGNGLQIAEGIFQKHSRLSHELIFRPPRGKPYQMAQQIIIN